MGIFIKTQQRETVITHKSPGMEEWSNRWETTDFSLKTQMKVTVNISAHTHSLHASTHLTLMQSARQKLGTALLSSSAQHTCSVHS